MIDKVCSCDTIPWLQPDYKIAYPLHAAVLADCVHHVAALILKGIDVNTMDMYEKGNRFVSWIGISYTPLHFATKQSLELVQMLISAGANVNLANMYGDTPLLFSIFSSSYNEAKCQIIKYLVDSQANVNTSNVDRCLPLSEAVHLNEYETVKLLLESKADVNPILAPEEVCGHSPIMRACPLNIDYEILELLIKFRADCNIQDEYGQTPLFRVIEGMLYGFQRFDILLDAGVNSNVLDDKGCSPLAHGIDILERGTSTSSLSIYTGLANFERKIQYQLRLALLENNALDADDLESPPQQTLQVIDRFNLYQDLLKNRFRELISEINGLFNEIYLLQALTGYFCEQVPEFFQNPSPRVKNLMLRWMS